MGEVSRRELVEAQRSCGLSIEGISSAAPYFQAESVYRALMADVDIRRQKLCGKSATAKARYLATLGELEVLSEKIHERRRQCTGVQSSEQAFVLASMQMEVCH